MKKPKEALKRKLPVEGEYDPSSPTSENDNDDNPAKKAALSTGSSPKKETDVSCFSKLQIQLIFFTIYPLYIIFFFITSLGQA